MKKITLKLTGGIYNNRIFVNYNPNTKTTASIVRAAVFNMLALNSGVILDLFAGSGSYGFEALSRGAHFVYFNDVNGLSIKGIKENAKNLEVNHKIKILNQDYLNTLNDLKEENIIFNYCFIDPPYDMVDEKLNDILNKLEFMTKKGSNVIVERKKASPIIENSGYTLLKNKTYGTRQIQIYVKK